MNLISKVKDKALRHKERHRALDGFQFLFADSIHFINPADWDKVAAQKTIFLSRNYLQAIEKYSPENTSQRYAVAYADGVPVVVLACQIADIDGERLMKQDKEAGKKLAKKYRERVLVCGNLVSSGLHGVAFAEQLDEQSGWRLVAEALYKIRRSEKLAGQVDFALIKDIKGEQLELSQVVERYSYRKIQTDPDMVLTLHDEIAGFDDYLARLNTKYRGRIRKVIKEIEQAGFQCGRISVTPENDKVLHGLYLNVERKSKTRLATLPAGYFYGLAEKLGEDFVCYGITRDDDIHGFISLVRDHDELLAYYVGFDYGVNEKSPIYFRLLQLVVEAAIELGCRRIHLGRSALEPKASLGATPVDAYVWARHRVPVVNYFVRKLFRNIPFDEAPERNVFKN